MTHEYFWISFQTPIFLFASIGWCFKRNDQRVNTLECINVNPERKLRRKCNENTKNQETNENWTNLRKMSSRRSCDLQFIEGSLSDIPTCNIFFGNNGHQSTEKHFNNGCAQLYSTHM